MDDVEFDSIQYVNIPSKEDGTVSFNTGFTSNPVAGSRPVPKPRPAPRPPPRQESANKVTPLDEKGSVTPPKVKPRPQARKPVDADSVDNLPFYRKNIEELITSNRPQKEKFEAACNVMKIQCSLNTKYEIVDLRDILQQNKDKDIRKIPQSFTILEKYATNLLKDASQRHPSWRSVQFNSTAYQNKVKFLVGAIDILKSLGYTEDCYNNNNDITGVTFPPTSATNAPMVLNIAVDLVIAQFEVEAMIMGEHPRSHSLQTIEDVPEIYFPHRQLVGEITTDEGLFELSDNKVEKKTVDYVLNKSIKIQDSIYEIPPPVPPKRNVSKSSSMPDDYRKQLSLGRPNEIAKEIPENISTMSEYMQPTVFEQPNVSREPVTLEYCYPNSMTVPSSLNGPGLHEATQASEPAAWTCLKCSSVERPNSKFCSECGSSLKGLSSLENEQIVSKGTAVDSRQPHKVTIVENGQSYHKAFVLKEETNKFSSIGSNDSFQDADEGWNCEHCTFVNNNQTNICTMCDRTSRNRKSVSSQSPVNSMLNGMQQQPNTSKHFGAPNPHRSADEKKTSYHVNEMPHQGNANKYSGVNPFRSAEERPTPQQPMGLVDAVRAGNFTATAPPRPLGKSRSDSQLDEEKLQEARKFTEELQQKKFKQQQDAEARKQKLIQDQNDMRENAQQLVCLLMLSESYGYSTEECFLAQHYNEDLNQHLLLKWLQTDWLKMVDEALLLCMQCFEKDEEVGPISRDEVKELLVQANGNKDEVPLLFSQKRKMQINEVTTLVKSERKNIIKALCESSGIDKEAVQILDRKRLLPYNERIHKKSVPTDLDWLKDVNIHEEAGRRMIMIRTGVSWGRSQFVFRLMRDGVDASIAELLQVVKENVQYTYQECLKFFQHECQTCFCEYSLNNIHVGFSCKCELCLECFSTHINTVIREQHVRNLVCPICFKPDIEDENFETNTYYSMLEHEIKHLIRNDFLKPNIKEIFDNNLFDFYLKKDENFRYCINCKNGFLWDNPNQIRMQCNQCNERMCFVCKEKWMDQHEGITCADFKAWKEANDPERQELGVQQLLQGRAIECPTCKARFELAEGGCMHFTCMECKYEFCSGCSKGFKRDGQCQVDASCEGKGMHTHHPRDCLYYVRDMEVNELEKLLNNHQIVWIKEYPPQMKDGEKVCGVGLQKDTEDGGRKDEPCGKEAPNNMAGLCLTHYKEYLVVLINNNGIDPVEVMDIDSMKTDLRRSFKAQLPKNNGETDDLFKKRLSEYLLNEVPLPIRAGRRNAPIVGGQAVGEAAAAAAGAGAGAPEVD